MTDGAIKKAFAVIVDQMPQRIQCISSELAEVCGVKITSHSTDEVLNSLPRYLASISELKYGSDVVAGWKPKPKDGQSIALTGFIPATRIATDEETLMIFDAALLWGEAFRVRYPEALWGIGGKPKRSLCYGRPVILGNPGMKFEFDVNGELYGHVSRIMLGLENSFSLAKKMEMRAFQFGFGPDPRLDSE